MITQFFGATNFLSRTTEDYKHLTIIRMVREKRKKALPCSNVLKEVIGTS